MNLRKWAKANGRDEEAVMAIARELGFNSAAWNSTIDETEDALLREHFAKLDAAAAAPEPVAEEPVVVDAPLPVEPELVVEASVEPKPTPEPVAEEPVVEPEPEPKVRPARKASGDDSLLGHAEACLKAAGRSLVWGELDYAMRAAGWQPAGGSHPTEQVRDAVRRHVVQGGERFCVGDYGAEAA